MALATLAQIRAGLQTRLATISGLQTYAYAPSPPVAPCAFVAGVGETEYHRSSQTGLVMWPMRVVVAVSTGPPSVEQQADLDEFISPTGTRSIKAAVEGAAGQQTLGGIVADVAVESVAGSVLYITEQGSYFGAEFTAQVYAGN